MKQLHINIIQLTIGGFFLGILLQSMKAGFFLAGLAFIGSLLWELSRTEEDSSK